MPTPSENKPQFSVRLQSIVDGVCKTRTELLDQLAGAVERLGLAKLSLETDGKSAPHHLNELRQECGTIRRELELHRAGHGC
jgi:hypothetical protein